MNSLTRACTIARHVAFRQILAAFLFTSLAAHLTAQPDEIKREPVESSVLASIGYDTKGRLLEIEFHSGAIYRYLDVPVEIHRRLLAAESKGHFFGANIRNKFRSERVKPREPK